MLASIDFNNKVLIPQIYLCKPNKQIIAKLNNIYDINQSCKLASLNEIELKIPSELEINHILQTNPNFAKVKDKYLLKFVKGTYIEWYIINKITDTSNDSTDSRTIHAYSLPYELGSKNIKNYKSSPIGGEATAVNCTTVLTDILAETIYTIDYIDASFDVMYRSIEISSSSVLDSVNQVAETFTALIIWDTENRAISMYNPDDFGVNRGLRFSTQKLMKGFELTSSDDEMVTRLKVFGKDDLSISSVTQTGSNYIENYSYFMNTDYMSESLISAMTAYNALLVSLSSNYTTYLNNLIALRSTLSTKTTELDALNTEMNIINNKLDLSQTSPTWLANKSYMAGNIVNPTIPNNHIYICIVGGTSAGTSPVWPTTTNGIVTDGTVTWEEHGSDSVILLAQKVAKQAELDAKQLEIDGVNANITAVNLQITNLQIQISIENNFTQDQINERNYFIIEKEITNNNFTVAQDLYDWGLKEFEKIKEPQISVTLDIVNFLEILEEQHNWDKLNLSDICTVYYPKLNVNIQCKIVEIDFNYEDASVKLTIANVTLVMSDKEKFYKNLYGAISTSTQVTSKISQWNNITGLNNTVENYINNSLDSAKQTINSAVNNSVQMNGRGITISDSSDQTRFIRMTNSVIGLSNDGGNTFKTAITPDRIVADVIVGTMLVGENLIIDATDSSSNKIVTINGTGMEINGLNLTITPPSTGGNGISLNNADGLVITKTDGVTTLTNKIVLNATDGFSVSVNSGTFSTPVWDKKLYIDTVGSLNLTGNIVSGTDILLNASTKTFDLSKFTTIVGTLASANIAGTITGKILQNEGGDKTVLDLANGTIRFGASDSDYKLKFDGTNLIFGSGALTWDNLDATSKTNLTGADGINGVSYRNLNAWSNITAYVNDTTYIDTVTYNGSTFYCKVSNTNQQPSSANPPIDTTYWGVMAKIGATGATGSQGIPGVDANLLPWVSNWNSNQTLVGAEYIVTPKIFSGTSSGGVPTGVAMGNINGFNGIAGYNAGTQTFSLNAVNGDVNISGKFGVHTVTTGETLTLGAYINGSKLYGQTTDGSRIYYELGTARTSLASSRGGVLRCSTYLDSDNTVDCYMDLTHNTIMAYQKPFAISDTNKILLTDKTLTTSFFTTTYGSSVNIDSNFSVGTNYKTIAAPTNGAIIEGNVAIGLTSPGSFAFTVGPSSGIWANSVTSYYKKLYPTSTDPVSMGSGTLWWNGTTLKFYNGSMWKTITLT